MQRSISLADLKSKLKAAAVASGIALTLGGTTTHDRIREVLLAKDASPVAAPSTMQLESIDEEARTATFVMSDATRDHVGDRLLPDGARVDNFMRNPQFLWMHDQDNPGIGKWLRVWVEKGQLKGTAYFTPAEIDEPGDPSKSFAERCWSLVKAGMLSAVSVFFAPLDAIWNGDGFDVLQWELLECSLVTVGMNPNALLDGKSVASLLGDRMKPKAATEDTAGDGGSTVTNADLSKCMKDLQDMHGQMSKNLSDHAKLVATQADIVGKHAKALADADAHAAKLASVHQDLQQVLATLNAPEVEPDEDTKKSAAELKARGDLLATEAKRLEPTDATAAKVMADEAAKLHAKSAELLGKSAKVLSEKNYGRIKAAMDHCKAVIDEHNEKHGEPDPKDDDPAAATDDKKNAEDFEGWFSKLDANQLKTLASDLANQQVARARGEIA